MKCKVKNHESKSIYRRTARRRNLVDWAWRMRGRRAGEFARTPVRIDIRRVEGLTDSAGQFIGRPTRGKIV